MGRSVLAGAAHAGAAGAAGRDPVDARSAAHGARARFAKARTRSARRSGRRSGTRCCRWRCPGILTGLILALSRAIGETAPLITIGALTYIPFAPDSVWSPFTVLPIQIFNWVSRPQAAFKDERRRRHPRAAGAAVDHERHRDRRARSLSSGRDAHDTVVTPYRPARWPGVASRPGSRRPRSIAPVKIDVDRLNFYYGDEARARRHLDPDSAPTSSPRSSARRAAARARSCGR